MDGSADSAAPSRPNDPPRSSPAIGQGAATPAARPERKLLRGRQQPVRKQHHGMGPEEGEAAAIPRVRSPVGDDLVGNYGHSFPYPFTHSGLIVAGPGERPSLCPVSFADLCHTGVVNASSLSADFGERGFCLRRGVLVCEERVGARCWESLTAGSARGEDETQRYGEAQRKAGERGPVGDANSRLRCLRSVSICVHLWPDSLPPSCVDALESRDLDSYREGSRRPARNTQAALG